MIAHRFFVNVESRTATDFHQDIIARIRDFADRPERFPTAARRVLYREIRAVKTDRNTPSGKNFAIQEDNCLDEFHTVSRQSAEHRNFARDRFLDAVNDLGRICAKLPERATIHL